MNDETAAKVAREECLKRAASSPSPEREAFELYAEFLAPLIAWENKENVKALSPSDYLNAFAGICATLGAHALRNATGDNKDVISGVAPIFIQNFASCLAHEAMQDEVVAYTNAGRPN